MRTRCGALRRSWTSRCPPRRPGSFLARACWRHLQLAACRSRLSLVSMHWLSCQYAAWVAAYKPDYKPAAHAASEASRKLPDQSLLEAIAAGSVLTEAKPGGSHTPPHSSAGTTRTMPLCALCVACSSSQVQGGSALRSPAACKQTLPSSTTGHSLAAALLAAHCVPCAVQTRALLPARSRRQQLRACRQSVPRLLPDRPRLLQLRREQAHLLSRARPLLVSLLRCCSNISATRIMVNFEPTLHPAAPSKAM